MRLARDIHAKRSQYLRVEYTRDVHVNEPYIYVSSTCTHAAYQLRYMALLADAQGFFAET